MASKLVRRGAIALAAIAALALILLAIAHLPFVRARLLERTRAYAARELGLLVDARSLHYNLATRSIELRDASVAAPGEPPLLRADRIRVVLTPRIFRGIVAIDRLELTRPRVTLVRHADGTMNLPATKTGPAEPPTPLRLGIVDIRLLRLAIDDEATGRKATIGPIDLSVDTTRTNAPPGVFGPAPFAVRLGAGTAAPVLSGTLAGRVGFDGARLSVATMTADTHEGKLSVDGSIDLIADKPRVDLRSRLTANLAHAARLTRSRAASLAGSGSAALTLVGPMLDPRVQVEVEGHDVGYRSLTGLRVRAAATLADGRITLHKLDLSSAFGLVEASGAIAVGGQSTSSSRVVAQWRKVDLDHILESAGLLLPFRVATKGTGRIAVSVGPKGLNFSETDWLSDLAADGHTRLAADGSTSPGLDGEIQLTLRRGAWSLRHAVTSSGARASLIGTVSGRITPATLESSLAGHTRVRLDELGSAVSVLGAAGLSLSPRLAEGLAGMLTGDVWLGGTLSRPALRAAIAGRGVRTADLPVTNLDATLSLDRRTLRVSALDADLAGARIHATGEYASGRIGARFAGGSGDIGQIARVFELTALPVTGSLRLEGTARGTTQSPEVRATLTARDVSIDGTAVGPLDMTLALAGERLRADVHAPAQRVRAGANLTIVEPFGYEADAQLDQSTLLSLVPARARDQAAIVDGTMSGVIRARGTLRRPLESTAEADLQALDLRLAGTRIVLDAPATITLAPDRVTTMPLVLRIGQDIRARLSGSLGRQRTDDALELTVAGPLSDLIALAAPHLPAEAFSADGTFAADLRVAGTLRTPEPAGTITLRAAAIRYGNQPPLTDVSVDARIERAQIVLQSLAATWEKASLRTEGTFPFRLIVPEQPDTGGGALPDWGAGWLASLAEGPQSATLTTRLTGITPAVLSPFLPPSRLREIDGTIAVTMTAETDALALDHVRATAVLEQASLTLAGVPLSQAVPTRVQLERGTASIADFRWVAQGNEIQASGSANVSAAQPVLDLAVKGVVDLRVLGAFASGVAAGGIARTDVQITGPLASPAIVGRIGIVDGELRIDTPALVASDLQGEVLVNESHAATLAIEGLINGGAAKLAGGVDLTRPDDPRGRVTLTARNVAMEYPAGFATESNADLTLNLGGTRRALIGRIGVLGGTYREPIAVTSGLLAGLQQSQAMAGPSSFLSTLDLDVTVETAEDVRIDNNYGRLNFAANLQVSGTPDQPGVVGRIEAAPNGEIYLAGNVYRIQRLVLDLTSPREIVPVVSFLAETRVGNVPIEIELECDTTGPCEQQIRSLAAGKTNAEAEALLFGVSGDAGATGTQLARLLSGEIFGIVGRSVGLDTLRLEQASSGASDIFDDPTLVAGDVNPASRLTLGKRIGERVEFAYSQDLASSGFTWSTKYYAPLGTSFRLLLLDDQSRSYEFRHEPGFGAAGRTRRAPRSRPRVAAVRIAGNSGFPERELRDRLKLTEGDRFDFATWQDDRDRLSELYRSRGFLEARIQARRLPAGESGTAPRDAPEPGTPQGDLVALQYTIERGPPTELSVRGITLPDELRERILDRWSSAVFDGFLERDARALVREHLYTEGNMQAVIAATVTIDAATGAKTLAIDVSPGDFVPRRLEFAGHALVSASRLYTATSAVGPLAAWIDPASLEQVIEWVYAEEGLLAAKVDVLEPETRAGSSIVRVVIDEGKMFRLDRLSVTGTGAPGCCRALHPLVGAPYRSQAVREGVQTIERQLRQDGFFDARVAVDTKVDPERQNVHLSLRVEPGARSVLTDIVVEGADPKAPLVAKAIVLSPGATVDPEAIGQTRRRLYDTGVYRSVDISIEPAENAPAEPSLESEKAVVARVRLEERPQYRFRYGLALNDDVVGPDERERRLGFAADLDNRDLLGLGTTAGVSARLRPDQQVGRLFLGANRFFGLPLRSNLFLQRGRQELNSDGLAPIVADETEVSAEQVYRLRRGIEVRYGYGLGRNRTLIEGQDFDLRVRIARLTTSALVDRRRDPFDPTGGWFTSASFELSRPGLGSDLSFMRSFAQYSQFAAIRKNVVVASAARVGLARTFDDQDLIPSERFFGGGATSVRGYREDDLGPRGLLGDAEGGRALVILNEEVRFPIYRAMRGVGFIDLGNVYPTVGEISLSGLLIGVGAGVRLDTPVGLLRLDLGVPANRRPFDPKWRLHFGLGHAF